MLMHSLKSIMRFLSLAAAVLIISAAGADQKDGVITLRIEDTDKDRRSVTVIPAERKDPAPLPEIKAASAVLMDVNTGQVLYSANPDVKRPNASTTKIMTAILAIENCKMTDTITAGEKACETPFTSIHLKPGEKISAKDLLTGMMVRSANDAAVVFAKHMAGTLDKFSEMMNKKAKEIGCKNTHFVTPHGLHDKNHYSTAFDLCLIARYAFRYPIFNEVVAVRKHALDSRTLNREDLVVFSKSKYLKNYPGADGVKSGYVKEAGYCYVGSATRDGWRLVSCVLKSDNAGRDTAAVMDYGFNNFRQHTVMEAAKHCSLAQVRGGAEKRVKMLTAGDLKVVVPKTGAEIITEVKADPVTAPVEKGAKLGKMTASVNGVEAGSVDLVAAEAVDISFLRKTVPYLKGCGILVVCMVGGHYGTAIAKAAKSASRRRRRVPSSLRRTNRWR